MLSYRVQCEMPKFGIKLRIVTTFKNLSLGLWMESNWNIKDERIAKRFKENKQVKKKRGKLLTLGKATGYT